jgi:hypothetical protein
MEESSDALDSAVYAAELYNQIKQEQMMGLNSIMGQGMIGNAQNSLMGSGAIAGGSISNAQQAAWNTAQLSQATRREVRTDRIEMHVKILQAENGFIVSVCNSYGDVLSPHIAPTIEDVNTVITSQLASRMLDRTE